MTRAIVYGLSHSKIFGGRLAFAPLLKSASVMAWAVTAGSIIIADAIMLQDNLDDIHYVLAKNAKHFAGTYYFILIFSIPLILWMVNIRAKRVHGWLERRKLKYELRLIAVPVCAICLYFSALSFSTYIYPWIPAEKGGGDYSDSPAVWLSPKEDIVGELLKKAGLKPIDGLNVYGPCIIIEQTDDVIYFALRADANGPQAWRRLSYGSKFTLPRIIQIRREAIESLIITKHVRSPFVAPGRQK